MSSSATKIREIRQRIKRDPRLYVRHNWYHPKRPADKYDFRTDDGSPIHFLADDKGPLNPEEWGSINVLLMARGCLKTTSVLAVTQWMLDMYPNTEAFMTAPTQDQVREFMDKFTNSVVDTPLEDRRVRDRMSHQKFETKLRDEHGDTVTTFSHLKSKSAWDADNNMRGPHSNCGIIDEFQDVDESAFSVFLEIIDQSVPDAPYFPVIFLIGTPKLKNTFFEDMWLTSNQRTWDKDEGEHGEWIDGDAVGEYKPDTTDVEEVGDLGSFTVKGWHIDQYNSPLSAHSEDKLAFKEEKYSEMRIANEVEARFYSPEDDLLSTEDVKAVLDKELGFRNSRRSTESDVYLTVDWGGGQSENASDTVFTVGEKTETGPDPDEWEIETIKIDFVDRDVSQTQELETIREYISKYEVDKVLVDEGHGSSRREELQEEYGTDLVTGVNFGSVTPSEDVRWRENDREEEVAFTVQKSYSVEKMVDAFKDGKFVVPKKDLNFGAKGSSGTKFMNQMTAPYKEFSETPSGKKKLKVMADRNDDVFDTFVYLWILAEQVQSAHTLTTVGLNRRF